MKIQAGGFPKKKPGRRNAARLLVLNVFPNIGNFIHPLKIVPIGCFGQNGRYERKFRHCPMLEFDFFFDGFILPFNFNFGLVALFVQG